MEDIGIRAIFIGVSVFVVIMTLTAIILYYNTARSIADTVSDRTDIASSFDNIVNSNDFKDTLTGVEVRSLINKYAYTGPNGDIEVRLIFGGSDDTAYMYVWSDDFHNYIIREEKLDFINPVSKYRVEKTEQNVGGQYKTVLKITEFVEEQGAI